MLCSSIPLCAAGLSHYPFLQREECQTAKAQDFVEKINIFTECKEMRNVKATEIPKHNRVLDGEQGGVVMDLNSPRGTKQHFVFFCLQLLSEGPHILQLWTQELPQRRKALPRPYLPETWVDETAVACVTELLLGHLLFVWRWFLWEILQKSSVCHLAEDIKGERCGGGRNRALGGLHTVNTPVDTTDSENKVAVHLH